MENQNEIIKRLELASSVCSEEAKNEDLTIDEQVRLMEASVILMSRRNEIYAQEHGLKAVIYNICNPRKEEMSHV